ncbi:MAG: hypothetical protein LBO70_03130, partial [Clostridiales Family XIII bacterium]|nr:hypothetical protein [Clostridiales Family XIII bacterium]
GHGNALRYIKERRGDGAIQWLLPYHILPDSIIPEILYTVIDSVITHEKIYKSSSEQKTLEKHSIYVYVCI